MDTLIYGNRKQDDNVYDASTPEKELAAYLCIFRTLDEDWKVYSDLDKVAEGEPPICQPCAKDLHIHCDAQTHGNRCGCRATSECAKRTRRAEAEAHQLQTWKLWRDQARAGNRESAKKLVRDRSARHYEYERVREGSILDPLEELRESSAEV